MSKGPQLVFENDHQITTLKTSTSETSLTSLSTVSESSLSTLSTDGRSSDYPKRADRAIAIQQVQQTWRVRREERDRRKSSTAGGKPVAVNPKQQQLQQLRWAPSFPSLCAVVQKTWTQAFDNKSKEKKNLLADRPKVFPSMISIIESNALVTQVRDLQEGEERNSDSQDSISRSPDSPRDQSPTALETSEQSVVAILPAGSTWNTAILQAAQSRSRAFLLLDLATIVRRTVLWKRTHPNITWVHSVSANSDRKLLQLLLMAGVRLVTSTRADIDHALNAMSKLKKYPKHQCLADSTTHTAPPDSYIRELLGAKVTMMSVDGAPEVHRLVRTVRRMQARQGQAHYSLAFVLRLQASPSDWMQVVESTVDAVRQYPEHRLSGISLDIGSPGSWKERQDQAQTLVEHIFPDHDSFKINLTGFDQEAFPDEWVQWWTRMQSYPRVSEVAVECSYPLVASTGALCTRIIGVRDQSSDDGHLKQSLYIDDGCYGSLNPSLGKLNPIPLGYTMDFSHSSTVWGPTCDGLDRVCRDIPLPKLDRDDWLVFPNMGCPGSLGTAFNGFEAPDTAYCVLGYFK